MNNNFFYKNLEFNATVFRTDNGLFFLPKEKAFYALWIKALKTIPNNPKKSKKYKLLEVTKRLKENVSRELFSFEMIEFIYEEGLSEVLIISENKKLIRVTYGEAFIGEIEETLKTFQWDSLYGEVSVEGLILSPNWW